jgi:hypothetical protein
MAYRVNAITGNLDLTATEIADISGLQSALDLKADAASLGTMSSQNFNSVNITGGTITGINLAGGSNTQLQFNNANELSGASGLSWDSTNRTLSLTTNTVTTSSPIFRGSQTWNNASSIFTGLSFDFTDTTSNASSLILDLKVSNVTRLKLTKQGYLTVTTPTDSTNDILTLASSVGSIFRYSENSRFYVGTGGSSMYAFNGTAWQTPVGNGTNFTLNCSSTSSANNIGITVSGGTFGGAGSGSNAAFYVTRGIAPTSGTGTFSIMQLLSVINQTGTSTARTYGILLNPSITNAYNYYAISTNQGRHSFWGSLELKTASYDDEFSSSRTLGSEDFTVRIYAYYGEYTVTLPDISDSFKGTAGRIYIIKKCDDTANIVTINTTNNQTIDGSLTYTLNNQYEYVMVQSSGNTFAGWDIIGKS